MYYRITFFLSSLLVLCCTTFSTGQQARIQVQLNHTKAISAVAFAPDGRHVATGGLDNAVKIWDTRNGRLLRNLTPHQHLISGLAYLPVRNKLLSVSWDKCIYIYDDESAPRLLGTHTRGITSVAPHPSGDYIAVTDLSGEIAVWDIKKARKVLALKSDAEQQAVVFGSKGTLISGNNNGDLQVWDMESQSLTKTLATKTGKVKSLVISANKKWVAVRGTNAVTALYSTESREIHALLRAPEASAGPVTGLAFHPKKNTLFTATAQRKIIRWNPENKTQEGTIATRQHTAGVLALSPDGSQLAATDGNALDLWDTGLDVIAQRISGKAALVRSVATDAQSRYIALGLHNGRTLIVDAATGWIIQRTRPDSSEVEDLQFRPGKNELLIAARSGKAYLYSLAEKKVLREFATGENAVRAIDFRLDGKYFASCGNNKQVKFWDARTGQLMRSLNGHEDLVLDIALSRDGKKMASASWDGSIKIWDVHNNKLLRTLTGHKKEVWAVMFSADGNRLFSGGADGTVRFWELATGKNTQTIQAHKDYVEALALSPNGERLATASWDKTSKVLDARTGRTLATCTGHKNYVKAVSFAADGKLLLTGSSDGTLRVWDTQTGKEKLSYIPESDGQHYVAMQQDGYFEGSPQATARSIHFVRGNEVVPLSGLYEKFHTPQLWALSMEGLFVPKQQANQQLSELPEITIEILGEGVKFLGQNEYETENENLKVQVSVSGKGAFQGARLYHNGKLVSSGTRGFRPLNQEEGKAWRQTYTVPLLAGENTIYASSFNAGRTEIRSPELMVKRKKTLVKPDLYVLTVGINAYKNSVLNLNYAVADANAFSKGLQGGAKSIFKNIHSYTIRDADFTRARFMEEMKKIARKARPEDVFVFFYAGHGVTAPYNGEKEFYLIPHDITQIYGNNKEMAAKGIPAPVLRQEAEQVPARKQLLLLDACHSGEAVQGLSLRGAAEQKALVQLARSAGMTLIASSGSEQFATEVAEIGHGVFTYALLEALQGHADGGIRDQKITVAEIKSFLEDRVPQLTEQYRGQPQYPQGILLGNDFPVVVTP